MIWCIRPFILPLPAGRCSRRRYRLGGDGVGRCHDVVASFHADDCSCHPALLASLLCFPLPPPRRRERPLAGGHALVAERRARGLAARLQRGPVEDTEVSSALCHVPALALRIAFLLPLLLLLFLTPSLPA